MDTFKCICSWQSCRQFKSKGVDREKIAKILEAARWAPSPDNMQTWEFIVVTSDKKREKLAQAAFNNDKIEQAPVTIVICRDDERAERKHGDKGLKQYSVQENAACMQNMLLEAHNQGLGSSWVGNFEEERVKDILRIPEEVTPLSLVVVGYVESLERQGRKFKITSLTYMNEYGNRINPVYDKFEWKGMREYSKKAEKGLKEKAGKLKDKIKQLSEKEKSED